MLLPAEWCFPCRVGGEMVGVCDRRVRRRSVLFVGRRFLTQWGDAACG